MRTRGRNSRNNRQLMKSEKLRAQMRPPNGSQGRDRRLRSERNEYTLLRFVDGLVVCPAQDCPRDIHARNHWNDDGTCQCQEGAE